MKKVTQKDVAALAEVSPATVDRVLNDRGGVSLRARQRVKEAIHQLGFGKLPEKLASRPRGQVRILVLLPKLRTGFAEMMDRAMRAAPAEITDAEVIVEVRRVPLLSGDEITNVLRSLSPGQYNGVCLFAVDAPGVRQAIDDVTAAGTPVVTVVSDVPSSRRAEFIGFDNIAAGRTAGRLMGRFLKGVQGRVAVIAGSMQIRDHMERFIGFRQIMGRDYRSLSLLPVQEGDSVAARNRALVIDLIRDHDNLAGIYVIGAGASGVVSALTEADRTKNLVVIAHELTDANRKALQTGAIDAVIAQDPARIAGAALRALNAAIFGDGPVDARDRMKIEIFLNENAV